MVGSSYDERRCPLPRLRAKVGAFLDAVIVGVIKRMGWMVLGDFFGFGMMIGIDYIIDIDRDRSYSTNYLYYSYFFR